MQIDLTGFRDVTERLIEHLTFAAKDCVVFGAQNESVSKQDGCEEKMVSKIRE